MGTPHLLAQVVIPDDDEAGERKEWQKAVGAVGEG